MAAEFLKRRVCFSHSEKIDDGDVKLGIFRRKVESLVVRIIGGITH